MDILSEFLDPIPLPAMAIAVFAIIMFLVISKLFCVPKDHAEMEAVREEIRFRLFDKALTEAAELEAAEEAEKNAAAEAESGNQDAAPPAEAKSA